MLVCNCLFRVGGAAVLLSNRCVTWGVLCVAGACSAGSFMFVVVMMYCVLLRQIICQGKTGFVVKAGCWQCWCCYSAWACCHQQAQGDWCASVRR